MKVSSKVTLVNGLKVSIDDKVSLDNGKVLIVQSFEFKVLVNHTHKDGEGDIIGIAVAGIDTCSGDYMVFDQSKVFSIFS